MSRLKLDCTKACDLIAAEEYEALKADALAARTALAEKTGAGNDFLGWVDLPVEYDREEFARIKFAADRIRSDSDALVVIGIGGSYLGARAAIEFLGKNFANQLSKEERGGPEIYFAGNNISTAYLADLLKVLEGKDISVNVISKSGTTTEPSIAFRVFKKLMEERYGREGAAKRIYATTDKARGALKSLADDEGYETFVVPDDVGGRYSVLTAVGLLPIAVAGADLDRLMAGAQAMREQALTADPGENAALQYAIVRNALYRKGYDIEIMSNYEPPLHYIAEWWKQLYGESEGKDGLGIFPASVDLTADLHSMGQYIQDGRRALMETVLHVENVRGEIIMSEEENDLDGLNYLAGRTMQFVNDSAMNGVALAHKDGGVPLFRLDLAAQDEETLGELFYFFEFACGVSGYLLGVNPFNQPGVESYKRNMFALLGKPGYEEEGKKLRERL